jgi:hypothetical protein
MNDMKKMIFTTILLVTSLLVFCQNWSYNNGGNAFDGKYKYAQVVGSGGEFPYNNPIFTINYFENSNDLNLYFSKVGYAGCDGKEISIKFDSDDNIYTFDVSSNSDKDTWFISFYSWHEYKINEIELLERFMKYSSFDVRISSDCGQSDYKFSLSGSTNAIKYVAKEWLEKKKEEQLKEKEIQEKNLKEQEIREQAIYKNQQNRDSTILALKNQYGNDNIIVTNAKCDGTHVYGNIGDETSKFDLSKNQLIVIDKTFINETYYKVIFVENIGITEVYVWKIWIN